MTDKKEEKTYSTRELAYKLQLYQGNVTKACKSGEINATKNEIGRWVITETEANRLIKYLSIEANKGN